MLYSCFADVDGNCISRVINFIRRTAATWVSFKLSDTENL